MTDIGFVTIFPELVTSFFATSLIGKAVGKGIVTPSVLNPRDWSNPPHHRVDDSPYGGGAGMVMSAEPLMRATEEYRSKHPEALVILPSARGQVFTQAVAQELSSHCALLFVCPRYEGVDERFTSSAVDLELSLGSFVMMGGEVAAMAMAEAVLRLIPGIMGNADSSVHESFQPAADGAILLEAPQYTRPAVWRGSSVPEELLSGNHELIRQWRHQKSIAVTKERRPDLLNLPKVKHQANE